MVGSPRLFAVRTLVVGVLCVAVAVAGLVVTPERAAAHGGTTNPPTRTYVCRFLEPSNPACADAWAANPQSLYDWMEVNIGDAAGRHEQLIADGELCGAGRDKFAAFNTPRADWPATDVTAGPFTVRYQNTAPHATAYYRIYVSDASFDADTDLLGWGDLELIHDSGPLPATAFNEFDVVLPERSGHHLLYIVWQRSDSPEAFYSCSDLNFGATTTPPTTTPPTTTAPSTTTTTTPPTTAPPTTTTTSPTTTTPPTTTPPAPTPGYAHLPPTITTTADWGTGWCANVTVTNTTALPVIWHTMFDEPGSIYTSWSAVLHTHGHHIGAEGLAWNDELGPGRSTTFGFCANRPTPAPEPIPGEAVTTTTTTTADWGSGFCANVTVANPATTPVDWVATLDSPGVLTSLWDATIAEHSGGELAVTGAPWNATLQPGATTTFGFCANR